MINTSTVDKNTNRTIIIPQGILNSDEVNVVYIPPNLSPSQPLIVKPSLGKNKPLRAHSLPIWDDELSIREDEKRNANISHFTATAGCSSPTDNTNQILTASANINGIQKEPGQTFTAEKLEENAEYNEMCCDTFDEGPILHLSSKIVTISNDRSPKGRSITVDAPEGINTSLLENIVKKSARQGVENISSSFNPPFSSSQFSNSACDSTNSSRFETTSGEIDTSMRERVMGGEYNVNTPICPPRCPPSPNMSPTGKNITYRSMQPDRINTLPNVSPQQRAGSFQRGHNFSRPGVNNGPRNINYNSQMNASNYSNFNPAYASSQLSSIGDSYYDFCDSSCVDSSSGELDDSVMGRVMAGEFNVITPMTPSPKQPTRLPSPQLVNSLPRGTNLTIPQPNSRGEHSSLATDCPCGEDYPNPGNATYTQPISWPTGTIYNTENTQGFSTDMSNIDISDFNPQHHSSLINNNEDSYYDDMYDSSCANYSSGEMDDSMMARVMGGEFNVITPMTPSPPRPLNSQAPPQHTIEGRGENGALSENCPCRELYTSSGNATFMQPMNRNNAYPTQANATYVQSGIAVDEQDCFCPEMPNSYYDDMYDSSALSDAYSGSLNDSVMPVTPMMPPPPPRIMPQRRSPAYLANATTTRSNNISMNNSVPIENCPCPEDLNYSDQVGATFTAISSNIPRNNNIYDSMPSTFPNTIQATPIRQANASYVRPPQSLPFQQVPAQSQNLATGNVTRPASRKAFPQTGAFQAEPTNTSYNYCLEVCSGREPY